MQGGEERVGVGGRASEEGGVVPEGLGSGRGGRGGETCRVQGGDDRERGAGGAGSEHSRRQTTKEKGEEGVWGAVKEDGQCEDKEKLL